MLCPAVIVEVCEDEGVRLEDRLPIIVTHGLCHLMGYRHDSKEELKRVFHISLPDVTVITLYPLFCR